MSSIVSFVLFPRQRVYSPVKKITLETINGKAAAESSYAPVFIERGFISDRGKLFYW
jgi:hypothetical protein